MFPRYLFSALLLGPSALLAAGCDEKRPDPVEMGRTTDEELAEPTPAPRVWTQAEQARLRAAVQAILSAGWSVTKTRTGSTPSDWHTFDPNAGFLVEGGNGKHSCRIWFLPKDWIGIRKVKNSATGSVYACDGVLTGDDYKIITHTTLTGDAEYNFYCRMNQGLFPPGCLGCPSLVNGGYLTALQIYAGRLEEADRIASRLLRKYCPTREERVVAVRSLTILGVPAKSVFLRAARENGGSFTSELGLFGGEEAIGILCEVVADPGIGDGERGYAASALEGHVDPRIGPALHTALKQVTHPNAVSRTVRALIHVQYQPAAPDLLAALEREPVEYNHGDLAESLATLDYKKAVPVLRRIVEKVRREPDRYALIGEQLEASLLRLTVERPKPPGDSRHLILPPPPAVVGQQIVLKILLENTGSRPFLVCVVTDPKDGLLMNGRPLRERKPEPGFICGMAWDMPPGRVYLTTCDISDAISRPGAYTFRYADSNQVTLTVKAANR